MGRRKDRKTRSTPCSISLPGEIWDKIDEYLQVKNKGKLNRSEFINEHVVSVLEEWEKERQAELLISESANKDSYNSPLGSVMTIIDTRHTNENKNIKQNDNNKPDEKMLEQMYLTPFDKIVTENSDDIEYMRNVMVLLDKRVQWVRKIVNDHDKPPKSIKRERELFFATSEGKKVKEMEEQQNDR